MRQFNIDATTQCDNALLTLQPNATIHYISQREPRRAEQETTVDALGESEAGERINGKAGARLAALALPALLQRALLEIAHGRHRCAASAAARADRMTPTARCARRCRDGNGRIQRVVVVAAVRVPAGGRRVVKQARAESRRRRREVNRRSSGANPCLYCFCSARMCAGGKPSLGADSAGASPVPLQILAGVRPVLVPMSAAGRARRVGYCVGDRNLWQ